MIKVVATDQFKKQNVNPRELNYIPTEGTEFLVSEERFEVLNKNNVYNAVFVKKVKENRKAKNKDYKFAIIVPNYNYGEWLEKCLNSILNQTYKNYEIIFVDDVSTDDSVQIAQKLLKKPHKIVKLKQRRFNGGARNEAYLHISKNVDYVWYVDSDDWLKDETVLEKINNALKYNPDVLFLGIALFKEGKEIDYYIPNYSNKYDAIKGWSGSSGKVIKKELATKQVCLYNEGTLKEDKNQHCKICIYMKDFDVLSEALYVWNKENEKSVTTVRDKILWGTSTIRHYADTKQLYLSETGKDRIIDDILKERLEKARQEMMSGGDCQF